jgi:2-haloacid dehalogenase
VKAGVQDLLSKLNDQGFRLAALTNSSHDIVADRMSRTGLISYFEKVMSAEQVRKYKPCCIVYQWALDQVQVKPPDAMIITSHAWDVAGAINAGMMAAYIGDSKNLYELSPKPQLLAKDLHELVDKVPMMIAG